MRDGLENITPPTNPHMNPADRLLVAGLGTPQDWQLRCEKMFEA